MNSSSRNAARVRCAAIHTAEGATRVADLRAFFDRTGTASSHAAADVTGALREGAADGFVPYERAAWTIRNANGWTDNLELCAFAAWNRGQWLAAPRLLEACARWLGGRIRARGLPPVHLSVAQLRAGQSGLIDHDDYTDASGDGTHWDVGENFPWDVVIPRAIELAGGSPPAPARIRRRRMFGWLTRNKETGGIYLWTPAGPIHLRTVEEVSCAAWSLDETADPNAVRDYNRRYHDVMAAILRRGVHTGVMTAGRGAVAQGPPEPSDDPGAVQPPPGFTLFVEDAPGHDDHFVVVPPDPRDIGA